MEPLPYDHTWKSNSIDVNSTELKWKFTALTHAKTGDNI
jgi:hypothetical protein